MASINPFVANSVGAYSSQTNYTFKDQYRGMFGGNNAVLDPYTTGYHVMLFMLPQAVSEYTKAGDFLTTVCKAVTVPGITVNPIEYQGINDMKWFVPGTTTLERNTFDCTFVEMAGIPVTTIMGQWVTIFRNILYGIADPTATGYVPFKYGQNLFKGRALYATTLPDGVTVQFAAVFTGVFPTKIPTDIFDSDRATQDKKEVQISFQFDQMLTGTSVETYATNTINAIRTANDTVVQDKYNNETGSATISSRSYGTR